MNLTKLFNKNYFIQNLKKSKTLFGITIAIVPILTVLVLINLHIENTTSVSYENSAQAFNIINLLGMYIIPIAISQVLFGYIFKRKSVDFIGSMPINRKTIFLTNFIGGILLILLIQILTFIFSTITLLVLPNTIINFNMLLDTFIIGTISYVFVFSATSIGMAIAGNLITQIVVTMLVLFLVPFTVDAISGFDFYEKIEFVQSGMENISISNENFKYYTIPYNFFRNYIYNDIIFSNRVFIKMIILSAIYAIIACKLFQKRKMENTEEAFSNTCIHLLIKGLTLVPMVALVVLSEATISNMILYFAIIFVYYYVYDILTNRKVKLKIEIPVFALTVAILFGGLFFAKNYKEENIKEYARADIKSFGIAELKEYYDDDNIYDLEEINYEIKDADLIDVFYNGLSDSNSSSLNYNYTYVKISLKDGKEIFSQVFLKKDNYNKIMEYLDNDNNYQEALDEDLKIEDTKNYTIIYENKKITGEDKSKIINLINSTIKDNYKEFNNKVDYYQYSKFVRCYYYKNHRVYCLKLPIEINDELQQYCMKLSNKLTLETLNKLEKSNEKMSLYYTIRLYNPEKKLSEYYRITNDVSKKIVNFVKNTNQEVNKDNNYIEIVISVSGKQYYSMCFYTNNVEEFMQLVANDIEYEYEEEFSSPEIEESEIVNNSNINLES